MLEIILGRIITWLCSWWYYRRAAQDLEEEAAKLRDLSTQMWQHLQGVPSFSNKGTNAPTSGADNA